MELGCWYALWICCSSAPYLLAEFAAGSQPWMCGSRMCGCDASGVLHFGACDGYKAVVLHSVATLYGWRFHASSAVLHTMPCGASASTVVALPCSQAGGCVAGTTASTGLWHILHGQALICRIRTGVVQCLHRNLALPRCCLIYLWVVA
jgi:hypothetical protein